jgi:translation elongation factor EF-Tu-like GTPase
MSRLAFTLVATVTFLTPEAGGRVNPVHTGYRGQFFYDDKDCDCVHTFDTDADVPAGVEVLDYIVMMNPEHRPHLLPGLMFLIREGSRTVGYGQVNMVSDRDGATPTTSTGTSRGIARPAE